MREGREGSEEEAREEGRGTKVVRRTGGAGKGQAAADAPIRSKL